MILIESHRSSGGNRAVLQSKTMDLFFWLQQPPCPAISPAIKSEMKTIQSYEDVYIKDHWPLVGSFSKLPETGTREQAADRAEGARWGWNEEKKGLRRRVGPPEKRKKRRDKQVVNNCNLLRQKLFLFFFQV